jgi:antitoxin MazE
MSRVTVGKWGKDLAISVPMEIAALSGLSDGEQVEIEAMDGDLVIRRPAAHSRADAQKAAEELINESRAYSLGDVTIQDLINEGRRGC